MGHTNQLDEKDPQRAHVASMWLAAAHRRAGTGSDLIHAIRTWAEAREVRALRLRITNCNRGAIAFYQRHGFSMTAVPEHYPDDLALFEYELLKKLNGPAGVLRGRR